MIGASRRVGAAVASYLAAAPWTVAYLLVLLALHVWMDHSPSGADAFIGWASTNLVNMRTHPLGALVASGLVADGPLLDPGTVITLWLGIAVAMWWLESRHGPAGGVGVFAAGHVGATLLTLPVILLAIRAGQYAEDTRSAVDVGTSYGAQACLAAVTAALPRLARAPWVVFVLGWPLLDADWSGWLPDFTTVGHLLSAGIGFVLAATLFRASRSTW